MSKKIAAALAVFFALSTPAFASVLGDQSRGTVHQDEGSGSDQPQQPQGEGEGGGGGD